MKILTSTSDFLPRLGGVANVCWELSRGLAVRGHEVRVVHWIRAEEEQALPREETTHGIRVERVPVPWAGRLRRRLHWISTVRRYHRDLARSWRPNVIHGHSFHPDGFAARWTPRSALRVFTNHTSVFLHQIRRTRRRLELRWILRGHDLVLAPSDELASESRRVGGRDAHFVPNGVDTTRFDPAQISRPEARRVLGIPPTAMVILLSRRFVEKNGLRYMAAAFAGVRQTVRDAMLLFCGPDVDGKEKQTVVRTLRDAGLEDAARYEGAVAYERMPLYYAAADVAVLPSLVEATSLSGLEAMASALPLVGTRVGGIPQILEHEVTGLLVEPRDADALASAVGRLLQDEGAARAMGAAARARVCEEFSWDAVARHTERLYEEALIGMPPRAHV